MHSFRRAMAAGLTLLALAAAAPANATPTTVLTDPYGDVQVAHSSGAAPANSPRIDILSLDQESTASAIVFTLNLADVGAPAPAGVAAAGPQEHVKYSISFGVGAGGSMSVWSTTVPGAAQARFILEWHNREEVDYCTAEVVGDIDAANDTVTVTIPYTAFSKCGVGPVDATMAVSTYGVYAGDQVASVSVYQDYA